MVRLWSMYIAAEMIKTVGDGGMHMLLAICDKVWKEVKILKEWEIGLMLPIFKKETIKM